MYTQTQNRIHVEIVRNTAVHIHDESAVENKGETQKMERDRFIDG